MIRTLLVDDDYQVLHSLERLLSWRRNDLEFCTASNGEEAISILQETAIDVVVTDLHMPEKDGFELAVWILSSQPQVLIFTMTAYPNRDTIERLQELGGVESFSKPLNTENLLERLDRRLSENISGHIRNIGIASLLQLMEMEHKTCTLSVVSDTRIGMLYIENGVLVHAQCNHLDGENAAITIAAWPSTTITITNLCSPPKRTVTKSIQFVVMEACRIIDEANSKNALNPVPVEDEFSDLFSDDEWVDTDELPKEDTTEFSLATEVKPAQTTHLSPAEKPPGISAAVVNMDSGALEISIGTFSSLSAVVQLTTNVFTAQREAIDSLGIQENMEEMVLTTENYWSLSCPLKLENAIAILVFDPTLINLGLARIELDSFVNATEVWMADKNCGMPYDMKW